MPAAQQLVGKVVTLILDPAILVVFSLGFLVFVWGLVEFLRNLNSGGRTDDGKQHMIWGIVGMFIMISVYGIISLISNTFGLGINARTGSYTPDTSRLNSIVIPH